MSTITTIQSTDAISASRSTINTNFANLNTDKAEKSGGTFTGDISVPDEAYGVGWNGSLEVPTKNALYDKIETMGGGGATTLDGLTDVAITSPTTGQALIYDGTQWENTTLPGGGDALTTNPLSQFASTTSLQLKGVISDETGSGALVFATSPTLTTPVLGTPSSGTLTNCTGLPIAGLVASTSTAIGVGTIELGHATDTTISRVSAGRIAVEGVNVPTISSTDTLTNKTLTTPAIASIKGTLTADTDGATITFDKNVSDFHSVTLGGNRTLALSNMAPGDRIVLRLQQDATGSRVPTFFTTIKWAGGSAPTLTTTPSKADMFGFLCTSAGNYDGFILGQNI